MHTYAPELGRVLVEGGALGHNLHAQLGVPHGADLGVHAEAILRMERGSMGEWGWLADCATQHTALTMERWHILCSAKLGFSNVLRCLPHACALEL